MHATSSTYTSPETPTCEVPSNGVVEISLLRGVGRSCEVVRPTGCVPALGIHINRTCQETRYCACACNIAFTQKFANCTGKQCDINVAFNLY